MSGLLVIRNRQRVRVVDIGALRRIARHLLETEFGLEAYELCLHLVAAPEMARLNEHYLKHSGSTDVITFDHTECDRARLAGELFISISDAVKHARRFRTTWSSELVRYVIHGLLHLRGYSDASPTSRRLMKREEYRLLRRVGREFRSQSGSGNFPRRDHGA